MAGWDDPVGHIVEALTDAEWDDLRSENLDDIEDGVRRFIDALIAARLEAERARIAQAIEAEAAEGWGGSGVRALTRAARIARESR